MTRRRPKKWLIEPVPGEPGLFRVLKGNKLVLSAVPEELALRTVRNARTPGERVDRAADDGYRTNITRQL